MGEFFVYITGEYCITGYAGLYGGEGIVIRTGVCDTLDEARAKFFDYVAHLDAEYRAGFTKAFLEELHERGL